MERKAQPGESRRTGEVAERLTSAGKQQEKLEESVPAERWRFVVVRPWDYLFVCLSVSLPIYISIYLAMCLSF